MRKTIIAVVKIFGISTLALASAQAAVIIDPPESASPPYDSLNISGSSELRMTFKRTCGPGSANSNLTLVIPRGMTQAGFEIFKDDRKCALGNAESCGGSDVDIHISSENIANLQIVSVSESKGTASFLVVARSPKPGTWVTTGKPANADIQIIHAPLHIIAAYPQSVVTAMPGAILDASASRSSYRPFSMAPNLEIKWSQVFGPSVALSSAGPGKASFKAPTVTGRTTLSFRVSVSDGRYSDAQEASVEIICVPTVGNRCGCESKGTVRCDGSCSVPDAPERYDEACGCENKGKVQCNSRCSVAEAPDNYGKSCGPCRKIQCDGRCSPPCQNGYRCGDDGRCFFVSCQMKCAERRDADLRMCEEDPNPPPRCERDAIQDFNRCIDRCRQNGEP